MLLFLLAYFRTTDNSEIKPVVLKTSNYQGFTADRKGMISMSHSNTDHKHISICVNRYYYIPITDTTLELSVFWPSDTESRINELRFSESISLSFKTRLTSVTCFCGDVTSSKLQAWSQRWKTC